MLDLYVGGDKSTADLCVCIWHESPRTDGFIFCHENGEPVNPDAEELSEYRLICERCGGEVDKDELSAEITSAI